MRENADQNNSEYGHVLRIEIRKSQNLCFLLLKIILKRIPTLSPILVSLKN